MHPPRVGGGGCEAGAELAPARGKLIAQCEMNGHGIQGWSSAWGRSWGVRGGVNWGNWRNGLETGGGEEREGDLGFQQLGQSLR